MPAETPQKAPLPLPSFSEVRKIYKEFFNRILKDERDFILRSPRALEDYLARKLLEFFKPLVSSDCEFSDLPASLRTRLGPYQPTLIGCHYRSIGRKDLRESSYFPTENYKGNARGVFDDWGGDIGEQARLRLEEIFADSAAIDDHFVRLLRTYFWLFPAGKTINEQVFHTNHPLGPIGIAFKTLPDTPEYTGAVVLPLGNLFPSLVADLVRPFEKAGKPWRQMLPFILKVSPLATDDVEALTTALKDGRNSLSATFSKHRDWPRVQTFFADHLPHNDLHEDPKSIITLLQAYCLYLPLSGRFLYTFPSTVQPELPSSGWTLMTNIQVPVQDLEYFQRLSELVFGEIYAHEVAKEYKSSFCASFSKQASHVYRVLDTPDATVALLSSLADSPIPLEAVCTLLGLIRAFPRISVYEGKSHDFLFLLVHQEFVESFLDRLKGSPTEETEYERNKQGLYADPPVGRSLRPIEEEIYNDLFSIEFFLHGLRINGKSTSLPEKALVFVYPPYDSRIICPANETILPEEQYEKLKTAIEDRESLLLLKPIPVERLRSSARLCYARKCLGRSADDHSHETLAEVLTYANREVLAALYEKSGRAKVYHDGKLILHSEFSHWTVPASEHETFVKEFRDQCGKYCDIALGENGNETHLKEVLVRTFLHWLRQRSGRHRGLLAIFHVTKEIPDEWKCLDCKHKAPVALRSEKKKCVNWMADLGTDDSEVTQFWACVDDHSQADGAVVFTLSGRVYSKMRIVSIPAGEQFKERVIKALSIKTIQANNEYAEIRAMGTKHNTALDYALMSGGNGFAVVVSEDGPISLFHSIRLADLGRKKPSIYEEYKKHKIADEDYVVRIYRIQ